MATRVTLLHNPGAGFERYSAEELLRLLHQKGYEVSYTSAKEDYEDALKTPGDAVVVAGGDGTVQKIAKHLIGHDVPIGLLPLGTANNIAATLGIAGEPAEIISGWDLANLHAFNVGQVIGPEGASYFFESVGAGLFPRLIRKREDEKKEKASREEELEDALLHQKEIVNSYRSHACTIRLDGEVLSGDYLMVEVMNIKYAGPNMELAPEATPSDGLLDVVLIREDEREQFSTFLTRCLNGHENSWLPQVRQVRKVEVEWQGKHYHIDDTAHEAEGPVHLEVQLLPQGLLFL
ncbi:diacylglycerol kinase family protein [Pontibacter sp. SGAir0037]|uniref:diacylglycerol/lipid kinase family protein n=1 Tax=Pontibacter sp. SGAir0037 TaxID=2571030 RepID=UPI0010CD4CF8|nr:diacylglycerol kinase family protein [Pontibacter sp. SGAir0037]QCR24637.1 diacylglycerol kinase [Pontibacter sp. SGAir0037]